MSDIDPPEGTAEEEAELRRLSDALDAAGRYEREWLDEAAAIDVGAEGLPGDAEVDAVLARFSAAGVAPSAAPRSRRWLPLVAAALLVATVGLYPLLVGEGDDPPTPIVMGAPLEIIAPKGDVDGFVRFEWHADPAASWYELSVEDASGGSLASGFEVEDTSWTPDAALVASWPNSIQWEIRSFDASGELLRVQRAAASR